MLRSRIKCRSRWWAPAAGLLLTTFLVVPLVAQEDPSRDLVRRALADDPVRIHLLPNDRVRIGSLEVAETVVGEQVADLIPGALVLMTSDPGINWRRDTQLRALLVESSQARDVVFVREEAAGPIERALRAADGSSDRTVVLAIDRLIASLGSGVWAERDGATQALLSRGLEVRGRLEVNRREARDPEMVWRIDLLLRELGRQVEFEPGFLGIAYHYRAIDIDFANVGDDVPVIGGAIEIQQVLRGTEAERSGLLDGDGVVEMNGKPICDPLGTGRITQIFAGLRAGHDLDLTVWRGESELWLEATMGRWGD